MKTFISGKVVFNNASSDVKVILLMIGELFKLPVWFATPTVNLMGL